MWHISGSTWTNYSIIQVIQVALYLVQVVDSTGSIDNYESHMLLL